MRKLNNTGKIIFKALLTLLIISGIFLFNKHYNFEKLKSIHLEKEKLLGEEDINMQLYSYYDKYGIDKYIVTDYPYMDVLPYLKDHVYWSKPGDLEPSSNVFSDESFGFLLFTPSIDSSKAVPEFVKSRVSTGEYTEIFYCRGYIFIKIH
jgi:hypothetical protein